MPGPTSVHVKRKANESSPDFLLLEAHPAKRAATATTVRYVRQQSQDEIVKGIQPDSTEKSVQPQLQNGDVAQRNTEPARRVYHLNHKDKTKGRDATFMENKHVNRRANINGNATGGLKEKVESASTTVSDEPLKRPGKGAAVKGTTKPTVDTEKREDQKKMEALADYMHQAALEEIREEELRQAAAERVRASRIANESKSQPKRVMIPKLSGQQSKEIHRRRTMTNGSIGPNHDIEMADESDYVYDTYVLASTSEFGATQVDEHSTLGNVGYLVITEEDQSLWETYLEDEPSDKDWNSDEEDENAEDYYGADYPEDELDSDDEFDRNPYAYRGRRNSNEEEWDEDTGAYSDNDEAEPFKSSTAPARFAKYLEDDGHSI